MAHRVPPVLNLVVPCSYVEFDGNGRPFSLVEPLYTLGIIPDPRGQLPAPEFVLYVQLDDEYAVGTFWITVETRTASGIVLPRGRLRPVEVTFSGNPDPLLPQEPVFTVRGLVFPEPGRYYCHVMCNHMSLHTREPAPPPAQLKILPGEAGARG